MQEGAASLSLPSIMVSTCSRWVNGREEKSDFSKEQIGRMYGVEGTPQKLEKSKN